MKKLLLLSVLLSASGVMQGMESDGKFLSARVGGYAVQGDGQNLVNQYLCNVIKHQGEEWVCTVVVDGDSAFSDIIKKDFFAHFKEVLQDKTSVEDALGIAYKKCEDLIDKTLLNEPLGLLASCFDVESQKMNLLSVGNTNSVFGGKGSFSARDDEYSCGIVSCGHEYADDFGYCVGASRDFWNSIKCDEIHSLLLAAKAMDQQEFYSKYAPKMNYEIGIGEICVDKDEDQGATEIAKRLVDVALFRSGSGNVAVMVTFLGSADWHFSSSSSTSNSDEDDVDGSSSGSDVNQLRKLAKTVVIPVSSSMSSSSSDSETSSSAIDSEKSGSDEHKDTNVQPKVVVSNETDKTESVVENAKELTSNSDGGDAAETSTEESVSGTSEKKDTKIKPIIPQVYWKLFIQNHKYKIGGLATILAIIVAAYKYNYLNLIYMRA